MRRILGAVVLGLAVVGAPAAAAPSHRDIMQACGVMKSVGAMTYLNHILYDKGEQDTVMEASRMFSEPNSRRLVRYVVESVYPQMPKRIPEGQEEINANVELAQTLANTACIAWFMEQ
jgi:hypothetical protein